MEHKNKMLIDEYWLDYGAKDEEENEYDWLEQVEEEEEYPMDYFAWSREQDGYHF
jgi:hypothetical protein